MRKRFYLVLGAVGLLTLCVSLGIGLSQTSTTTCRALGQNTSNCAAQGGARLVIGGIQDVVSGGKITVKSGGTLAVDSGGAVTLAAGTTLLAPMPATQTIAAGGTIAADACGGRKNVTAAGAVTTDTTNSITAPAAGNSGCTMVVCNVGATNAITIDKNANILLVGGADVALLGNSCITVGSNGTIWRQLTAQLTAT